MAAIDFRCPGCRAVLGQSTGARLIVGAASSFFKTVTVRCTACGRRRTWVPTAPADRPTIGDRTSDAPSFKL